MNFSPALRMCRVSLHPGAGCLQHHSRGLHTTFHLFKAACICCEELSHVKSSTQAATRDGRALISCRKPYNK